MSASPNQQTSPPSAQNEAHAGSKVVVPLPVLTHSDEIYCYIFVKGSLYARYNFKISFLNQS